MTARKPSAVTSTRVWQRMLSGRRLDLLDPSPLDIEIADIAHGLARVARWNGQTSGAHIFSVAQHTLLVEAVMREQAPRVDARLRLAALLHDAPEYVIGDMISPFKAVIGGDYKVVEKRLLAAIHIRFGLPPILAETITQRLWRYRVTSFPAPELDHIRYVCMVDDSRARRELGYRHRYDMRDTVEAVHAEW